MDTTYLTAPATGLSTRHLPVNFPMKRAFTHAYLPTFDELTLSENSCIAGYSFPLLSLCELIYSWMGGFMDTTYLTAPATGRSTHLTHCENSCIAGYSFPLLSFCELMYSWMDGFMDTTYLTAPAAGQSTHLLPVNLPIRHR